MGLKSTLRADFKRAAWGGCLPICALYCLAAAALYALGGQTTWACTWGENGAICGFLPYPKDPSLALSQGYSPARAAASAAIAHTVVFPVAAVALLQRFYLTDLGAPACATFAHGAGRLAFVASKAIAASALLQGCYLLITAAAALAVGLPSLPDGQGWAMASSLAPKLGLALIANESFIVFHLAVCALVRNPAAAAATSLALAFAGLILFMAMPQTAAPLPTTIWMQACGLGEGASASALGASAVGIAVCIAASAKATVRAAYCGGKV